jgi:hypothetical protein
MKENNMIHVSDLDGQYWRDYPILRGRRELLPVLKIVGDRGFIAGSFAAYVAAPVLKPMRPNDIDIFATTDENAEQIANELLIGRFDTYEVNELSYTLGPCSRRRGVQVIKPNPAWQKWPNDMLMSFDFDVSRAVVTCPTRVIADINIGNLDGKVLRVNNPLRSLKRAMKYHARGVEFTDRELHKLFLAWDQLSATRKAEIAEGITRAEKAIADEEERRMQAMASATADWYSDDDYFEGE